MSQTVILSKQDARKALQRGVQKLADAVITTMGPAGRLVLIEKPGHSPHLTKDGVTVAKNVKLSDPTENLGAGMVRQAAEKVVAMAGDGTTSVTRLASHLVDLGMEGVELGINPVGIKTGMLLAAKDCLSALEGVSDKIVGMEDLKHVATISANGDPVIGETIANAMEEVGSDGVVIIEESRDGLTKYEMVEGMEFARGYMSPYFSTNQGKMLAAMADVSVLLINNTLGDLSENFMKLLDHMANEAKPLLIIAEGFSDKVMSTLILNKSRGVLQVCAVKAPEYAERRTHVLQDIAVLTGATVLDKAKNLTFKQFTHEFLGTARRVTVTRDTTTIVDGGGKTEDIAQRVMDIKGQIDIATSNYDKEHLQQRLSKLLGGVAVIHVGGINETDMLERKDRFEDALNATQAAMEEGIVPGGGISYLKIRRKLKTPVSLTDSEKYGYQMVINAMPIFFKTILKNGGYTDEEITRALIKVDTGSKTWLGIDIETKEVIDFKSKGILDPTKVVRSVIETGIGVAANLLLVECTISEQPDPKKPDVDLI